MAIRAMMLRPLDKTLHVCDALIVVEEFVFFRPNAFKLSVNGN